MIYLLRFTEPLGTPRHTARYYLGYTSRRRVADRLAEHRNGEGAAITRAAVERVPAHIEPFTVVWAGRGDRWAERILKNRKRHADLARMTPAQVRAYISRKAKAAQP
jgi:predicted GIY-YIG superfamily endonuclease